MKNSKKSSTKIIHINRNVIQQNAKRDNPLPVCRVEYPDGSTKYGFEVHMKGPSRMIYAPDNPRKCGAKLWMETDGELDIVGETTYKEMMKNA